MDELLKKGKVQESTSAFGHHPVLARKKDGRWRMCINFKPLNKITVKQQFRMLGLTNYSTDCRDQQCIRRLISRMRSYRLQSTQMTGIKRHLTLARASLSSRACHLDSGMQPPNCSGR